MAKDKPIGHRVKEHQKLIEQSQKLIAKHGKYSQKGRDAAARAKQATETLNSWLGVSHG